MRVLLMAAVTVGLAVASIPAEAEPDYRAELVEQGFKPCFRLLLRAGVIESTLPFDDALEDVVRRSRPLVERAVRMMSPELRNKTPAVRDRVYAGIQLGCLDRVRQQMGSRLRLERQRRTP